MTPANTKRTIRERVGGCAGTFPSYKHVIACLGNQLFVKNHTDAGEVIIARAPGIFFRLGKEFHKKLHLIPISNRAREHSFYAEWATTHSLAVRGILIDEVLRAFLPWTAFRGQEVTGDGTSERIDWHADCFLGRLRD